MTTAPLRGEGRAGHTFMRAHMHIARSVTLFLAGLLLVGCGDSSASENASGNATPGASRSRTASGGPGDAQADMAELADYDLNMGDLEKYTVAQLNMMRAMHAAAKSSPDAEGEADDETDAEGNMPAERDANTLGGMEAKVENTPFMRKAVEDAGLDAREYATIALSYMTSAMAAGLVKSGRPVDSVATMMKVNPDNVDFILKNETKIAPLFARMQAEAKKLEGGE